MDDAIIISGLEVWTGIGIDPEELNKKQKVTLTVTMVPKMGTGDLQDAISSTVDYAEVRRRIADLAGEKHRNLVETLAEEIAAMVLTSFPVTTTEVEVRKYPFPDTGYVAVKIRRTRRTPNAGD